jgi:CDP-4-dehydro-6-deoxyglucose reductase, E3
MPSSITALVKEVKTLSETIVQLILEPEQYIPYLAGQYLQIQTKHYQNFFSIANAPLGSHHYELHIRHDKDNPSSQELLREIQDKASLSIKLPFGQCDIGHFCRNRSLVLIAGGTGFAPIKAIIEQLLFDQDSRLFSCYWGAKQKNDLYAENLLKEWHQHVKTFQYLKLYTGKGSYHILDDVLINHPNFPHNLQFILSGPFDMVFEYRDQLIHLGVAKEHIFSDAFEYEGG